MSNSQYKLTPDRLERIDSWGMNRSVLSHVFRPSTSAGINEIFDIAHAENRTIALRGTGCSYGDASMNAEQIVLDLTRMNRILSWDPAAGRIEVEPGVTIRQLWQYCIGDGWWPPVVSGTSLITLGGALGMNIHGKNNFAAGTIGEHVEEIDLMLPSGAVKTIRPVEDSELFHAVIGGFGMLGVITRIALRMKRVYSGLLSVEAFSTRSFAHIIDELEMRRHHANYLVGWIDCFASGVDLGRGLVHQANYLAEGEDLYAAQTLKIASQEIPDTMFGLVPRSIMGTLMRPFSNNIGMNLINQVKFLEGNTIGNDKTVRQPHAQFAFLLDYVPNWKFAYKPGGLIQFQSFIPFEHAERVFTRQIQLSHKRNIIPFLGVFKRHRPDSFLMSHAVDGFSLALDYPFTEQNKNGLAVLVEELAHIAVEAGGRFYFAKDSHLTPALAQASIGADRLARFTALKHECDPDNLLVTDLSRRLFGNFN